MSKMPEVPATVVRKLIYFSLAMIIVPLTTFFLMQSMNFGSVASGGTAALIANIVLVGYVVVAFTEDLGGPGALEEKKNE